MKPWTAKTDNTAKSVDATTSVSALIDAVIRGELDEAQTLRLCSECPELDTLALLAAGQRIAEQNTRLAEFQNYGQPDGVSIFTSSGMVPIYAKPTTPRRRQTPGARLGQPGTRRETPTRIDKHENHRFERCPHCEGKL